MVLDLEIPIPTSGSDVKNPVRPKGHHVSDGLMVLGPLTAIALEGIKLDEFGRHE
jgi:hypothetical protein